MRAGKFRLSRLSRFRKANILWVLALAFGFSVSAQADMKLVRPYVSGGVLLPWPAAVGFGGGFRILDMLQVGASAAPLEWMVARAAGKEDFIWGTSAFFILPVSKISPLVGFSFSRRHLNATDSSFYGHREGVYTYLNPAGGIEYRASNRLAVQAGIFYQLERRNGVWKKESTSNTGTFANTGLMPFASICIFF